MSEQTKQYKPLTGPEIVDYICAEIRTALERSGQLPLHRAFHEMSFVGGIKVSGWGTVDAKVQVAGAVGDTHPDDAEAVEIAVGIKAEAEPPSLVRERMAGEKPFTQVLAEMPTQPLVDAHRETVDGVLGLAPVPPSEITDDELPVTQDSDGNFPCTNFGSGCDHVPFASKAAMISHRNNWCAVSGRRRQR